MKIGWSFPPSLPRGEAHQRLRVLRQKGGILKVSMTIAMRYHTALPGVALLAASAVAILAVSGLTNLPAPGPTNQGAEPSTSPLALLDGSGGPSFSNGVARVNFHGLSPQFTIYSLNDSRVATIATVYGLAEINPNGTTHSFAPFLSSPSPWHLAFANTSDQYSIALTASVPVQSAEQLWNESADELAPVFTPAVGTVNVTVNFALNRSSLPDPAALHVWVNASNWPWFDSRNSLGIELGLRAYSSTRIEYGDLPNGLDEASNGTGNQVASFLWGRTATVTYGGGSTQTSVAGSFRSVAANELNSTVRLMFSGVAGGYASFSFDPFVVLNLGAFEQLATWVLTPEGAIAILTGASVVTVLAIVAMARRELPVAPE